MKESQSSVTVMTKKSSHLSCAMAVVYHKLTFMVLGHSESLAPANSAHPSLAIKQPLILLEGDTVSSL